MIFFRQKAGDTLYCPDEKNKPEKRSTVTEKNKRKQR